MTDHRDNRTIVESMLRSLQQGDITGALAHAHDDVVWIVPGPPDDPLAGRYLGRDHVHRLFAKFLTLVDDIEEYVFEEILAAGSTVVTIGYGRYRFVPSERWVTIRFAYVARVRDAKVVEFTAFRHDIA